MANPKGGVVTSDGPDLAQDVPDRNVQAEKNEHDRLRQIVKRFAEMESSWSHIKSVALEDDQFLASRQWDDQVRLEREEDDRPVLTYNLLLTYCHNIVNQVRQNWPQVKVQPVDSMRGKSPTITNLAGSQDYQMADVYMGIVKNIEYVSRAKYAYITGIEHSTQHGFGFFRVMPEYPRNDTFHQEIRIKRIMNSYQVLIDGGCEEADFSDMTDCFVFSNMNRDAFKRKYPNARAVAFEGTSTGTTFQNWFDAESLRVAEYMWIEYVDDEVVLLSNGMSVYRKDVERILDEVERDTGVHEIDSRKVKRGVCMWQKMTAVDVLEGPTRLPCSYIPVFPVVGKELLVDGKVVYRSAIHDAKDAQKTFNYWKTAATETVALAPRAPWVLTDQQIEGYEDEWDSANRKNLPYLTYRAQDGVPPPVRTAPTAVAAAELTQAESEKQVIQDIIGLHEANKGEKSNEKSGRAIVARQEQGNLATFVFPDNLSRAMEHMARVIVEMIPRVYDTQRIVRIRMPDDTEDFVEINQSVVDEDSGKTVLLHDIGYGKYDAVISVGPSYATQRQEGTDAMLALMERLSPEKADAIAHLIVKGMDFPGADAVYALLRKILPPQLKTPEEIEADLPPNLTVDEETGEVVDKETGEPPEPPPPTPEQQAEQAKQDASMAESQAKTVTAEATEAKAKAEIRKSEAEEKTAEATIVKAEGEIAKARAAMTEESGQAQQAILAEVEKKIVEALKEHDVEVDDKITDAVVDALKRVNAKMSQTSADANSEGETNPSVVVQGAPPKVERIDFTKDADGNLAGMIPTYDDPEESSKAPRIAKIKFTKDTDGAIDEAIPTYENEQESSDAVD